VVPGLVAPALAVGVAERLGWRWVFLGLAPLVLLSAALVLPGMRRRERAERAPEPRARALTTPGRAPAGIGVALAVRALIVFAFFGVESFLPLSLATVRSAPAADVAALLTLSALGWTAGAFVQARASARWGAPALAQAGVLALLAGIGCAGAALFEATPLGVALGGWTLASLGMGFAYNTATASAMRATRAGAEGATGTALAIADAVAASAATALGGALLAAEPLAQGSAPLLVVAAFGVAAAVGAASLGPARRLRAA
jgi:predicted MFS family arabinose efflux permease